MNLKYIELKSGFNDDGPAWIGFVKISKSGQTIYFNNKALKSGNGTSGNYFDIENGDEYWISTPKKNGQDRNKFRKGNITIQSAAIPQYLALRSLETLPSEYSPKDIPLSFDISEFHEIENKKV